MIVFLQQTIALFSHTSQVECPVLLEDGMPGQHEAVVFRHGRPPMCQHCPGSRRHAQQVMVVSINWVPKARWSKVKHKKHFTACNVKVIKPNKNVVYVFRCVFFLLQMENIRIYQELWLFIDVDKTALIKPPIMTMFAGKRRPRWACWMLVAMVTQSSAS